MFFKKRRGWFKRAKEELLKSTEWKVVYYNKSTNTHSTIVSAYWGFYIQFMQNPVLDIEKALVSKFSDYSAYPMFNYARHLSFITDCVRVEYRTCKERQKLRDEEFKKRDKLIEGLSS